MISATVIKDSINWLGSRVTTLVLEYPRYIHSEFMTHRVFSKNSASSRAIPIETIIRNVQDNTVYPIWTKNRKGMSGEIINDDELISELDADVYFMRDWIIAEVNNLKSKGVHKQNANRYLEPFQHIKVICTGTDWNNFFELRDHPDAMPEIQILAKRIKNAREDSTPTYLQPGEWHIPFEDNIDEEELFKIADEEMNGLLIHIPNYTYIKRKISVARCARISYLTFDGKIDYNKDIELYNFLVSNNPKHLSPTEHQARVPTEEELAHFESRYIISEENHPKHIKGKYISNLSGWIQYRKIIEDETYR